MSVDKKSVRLQVLEEMDNLPASYIQESDEGIFQNLESLPEFKDAQTVFAYYSVGREPDTRKIIEHALSLGKRIVLPISLPGGVMELREIQSLSELQQARFGIPAPPETAKIVPPEEVDIILVPAVTYDMEGHRLGRGGGYYDRFLAKTSAFSVGLARERLIMDAVPREAHDMAVNCVITEKRAARLQ